MSACYWVILIQNNTSMWLFLTANVKGIQHFFSAAPLMSLRVQPCMAPLLWPHHRLKSQIKKSTNNEETNQNVLCQWLILCKVLLLKRWNTHRVLELQYLLVTVLHLASTRNTEIRERWRNQVLNCPHLWTYQPKSWGGAQNLVIQLRISRPMKCHAPIPAAPTHSHLSCFSYCLVRFLFFLFFNETNALK